MTHNSLRLCWCGGEVGTQIPGDADGLGCLEDIYHEWREAPLVEPSAPPTTRYADCGYTLAHSSEDTGGLVQSGYSSRLEASKRLHEVLRAQRGAEGVTLYRNHGEEIWRVSGRETLTDYRIRMGWIN